METKLPIMFSKRITPELVDQMISDERIQELLKTEHLLTKMYDYQCNASQPLRYFMPDPTKPHGIMCSIEKTDEGYFCNVKIPEQYVEFFNCYAHPVVHPMCTYMEAITNPRFRIVFFKIYEIEQLKRNEIYNGVNYEEENNNE